MHVERSIRQGCSQVLFHGILSPHIYSITLRLRRGVGATCLTGLPAQRFVQTPLFTALDGGFSLGSASSLGVKHSSMLRLSQDASSTCIPPATTISGTTIRKAASKPSRNTNLTSPSRVSTDVTDQSHRFRGRNVWITAFTAPCTGYARCGSQMRR